MESLADQTASMCVLRPSPSFMNGLAAHACPIRRHAEKVVGIVGSKKHYGYAPCPACGKPLSFNGGAYTSHYKKHIREGIMVQSITGGYRVVAEHHAHLTPETRLQFQTVVNTSALEQSDSNTPPAQAQVA